MTPMLVAIIGALGSIIAVGVSALLSLRKGAADERAKMGLEQRAGLGAAQGHISEAAKDEQTTDIMIDAEAAQAHRALIDEAQAKRVDARLAAETGEVLKAELDAMTARLEAAEKKEGPK